MIYAQKDNRVVKIDEESIERYANQGYKIVDDKGAVIRETIPADVPNLQRAYREHTKEIAELKAEVDALKAELEKAQSAKAVKAESEDTAEVEPKAEPKPKTRATKKSE